MTYNPDIHHRRSVRLKSYDYRSSGAYFVTVCMSGKELILAEIVGETPQLTPMGEIVRNCLNEIPQHFPNAELDMHVIMPNHLHAILVIHPPVGATHASPLPVSHNNLESENQRTRQARARHPAAAANAAPAETAASPLQPGPAKQSLGAIVGSFKSACTKRINELRGIPGITIWQRSFHEHIIRNDNELQAFRDYIVNNPARREEDSKYPSQNKGKAGIEP